ncbi:MAG TPA: class I SAM-dependent methyltransferase [Candidatus Angelobacter sp.]|nr:class I SAM-dependent methyltransferase [Candidatus Angelobacter sp.]
MAAVRSVMNYREQEKFLQDSRIWGGAVCLAFLAAAGAVQVFMRGRWSVGARIFFPMIAVAVAVLIYYTPDYLYLSVTPDKERRWEINLRWRIVAAVLIIGLGLSSTNHGRLLTLVAVAWLSGANWLARKEVPARFIPAFFWLTDLVVLFLSLIESGAGTASILLLLLAAATHLAIVRLDDHHAGWGILVLFSGLIVVAFATGPTGSGSLIAGALLLLVAISGTCWLAWRARAQNARNIAAAMEELMEFTGYSADRIRQLWATSNQQLAANWEAAKPPENNPEQMAEWYRQNSELYLFAISAYNLEYKRIRSNMKVLRLARGGTLDYGAGNGEILLELARRGQRAAYYDVDGMTMRFARHRAERQKLAIDFFTTKEALAASAREHGFDTVFSFDVLEHLPDLAGELTFLSSLLAPGGIFVFDVPAGSTRAHPMHLNHNLNVLAFMKSKGLKDERGVMLRLPFRKEEKFVFRKTALSSQRSAFS